jgi:methylmalonyl-CoA mutase
MAKAIESGIPKLTIEESAARKQARIDRGDDVIVGVNKYRLGKEEEEVVDILEIDNHSVREAQINRLAATRASRDEKAVKDTLESIYQCANGKPGNLLDLAIKAVRARATVGEISYAMERVFGRFKSSTQTVTGVYGAAFQEDENWRSIARDIEAFSEKHGRRPRILVCKMGQDGHDRGAKVIATAFADAGFDVDLSPMFSTPAEVARQAVENDVHVVGVSSQAAGHKTLVPELIAELKKHGADDIIIVAGGVIPRQDYNYLYKAGVELIFGPGTPISIAVRDVLDSIHAAVEK